MRSVRLKFMVWCPQLLRTRDATYLDKVRQRDSTSAPGPCVRPNPRCTYRGQIQDALNPTH